MALAAKAKGKGYDKETTAGTRISKSETKDYTTETKEPQSGKRQPVQRMKSFKSGEDNTANSVPGVRFLEDEIHEDEEPTENKESTNAAKKQKRSQEAKESNEPTNVKKQKRTAEVQEPVTPDEPTKTV